MRRHILVNRSRTLFLAAWVLVGPAAARPALAQKTDTVAIVSGGHVVGEMKQLQNGKLELSTSAMSTVYVEWPKVSTVTTNKRFEIDLADGRRYFGSLRAVEAPNRVALIVGTDTVNVSTQTVVTLSRLKPTFWDRLDGSIDLGFNFTQQNTKVDLNLNVTVKYKAGLRNYRLNVYNTFSRQSGTADISSAKADFTYLKEIRNRWFYSGDLEAEQNSQLDLDLRSTLAAGAGRFLVQTNKVGLALWAGLAFAVERYTGQPSAGTVPAFLTSEFNYFVWGALDKELTTQLAVLPVLGSNRWRIQFNSSLSWEVVQSLYFKLGVNESFDSNPPTEGANKNDLNFTTSLGWSF